jgi:hypothetical protein
MMSTRVSSAGKIAADSLLAKAAVVRIPPARVAVRIEPTVREKREVAPSSAVRSTRARRRKRKAKDSEMAENQ